MGRFVVALAVVVALVVGGLTLRAQSSAGAVAAAALAARSRQERAQQQWRHERCHTHRLTSEAYRWSGERIATNETWVAHCR